MLKKNNVVLSRFNEAKVASSILINLFQNRQFRRLANTSDYSQYTFTKENRKRAEDTVVTNVVVELIFWRL